MRRLLITAPLLLIAALGAATPGPTTPPDLPTPCAVARQLVDDARPQEARALLLASPSDAVPARSSTELSTLCRAELLAADAAAGAAVTLTQRALDARPAARDTPSDTADTPSDTAGTADTDTDTDTAWKQVLADADAALRLDRDAAASDGTRADAVREAARKHVTPPDTSLARSWGDAWTAFVKTVSPSGTPLLALVVALAVIGVLARALTPATVSWPALAAWQRVALGSAGLAGALGSAALVTCGPAFALEPGGVPPGWHGMSLLRIALALVTTNAVALLVVGSGHAGTPAVGPRRWWWVVAAGVLVATVTAAFRVTRPFRADVPAVGVTLVGLAGAALAILTLATWLATQLRVVLDVRSESDGDPSDGASPTGTGHLLALINQLGAERPRGLEAPRGSDVTALSGQVLTELPQGKVVAAAIGLVRGLLGSTPWRVTVEKHDDDHLSVLLSRNGRSAGSAAIDRAALVRALPDGTGAKVDLYRAAAAEILITLSRHHAFPGLCGATSAPSLARHFIATTDLAGSADATAQRTMLAQAVDLDPGSWLAQVALWRARWRQSTDVPALSRYIDTLTRFVEGDDAPGQRPGFEALRLRALYTRSVAAINLYFVQDDPARDRDLTASRVRAVDDALRTRRLPTRLAGLAAALDDAMKGARLQWLDPPAPDDRRPVPTIDTALTPTGEYNVACLLATLPTVHPPTSDARFTSGGPADEYLRATAALHALHRRTCVTPPHAAWNCPCDRPDPATLAATTQRRAAAATALAAAATLLLENASDVPALAAWKDEDPQLADLRATDAYRDAFGADPLRSVLDLEPFAPHATALRTLGLVDSDSLVRRGARRLAADLGVLPSAADALVAAARTVSRAPTCPGGLDVAAWLLEHRPDGRPPGGFTTVEEDEVRDVVDGLKLSAADRATTNAVLDAWLRGTSQP